MYLWLRFWFSYPKTTYICYFCLFCPDSLAIVSSFNCFCGKFYVVTNSSCEFLSFFINMKWPELYWAKGLFSSIFCPLIPTKLCEDEFIISFCKSLGYKLANEESRKTGRWTPFFEVLTIEKLFELFWDSICAACCTWLVLWAKFC